jgi:formylglycine-generating enzyme required for sulfatase activity
MVVIPAGEFVMGERPEVVERAVDLCRRGASAGQEMRWCSPAMLSDSEPEVRVLLPAFAIDRVEVSNTAFRACVRAGACPPESLARVDARFDAPQQPAVGVTFDDAAAYCRFRGKRLPTEAEWEKAARGSSGRLWPWGDDWDGSAANHGRFEAIGRGDFIADDSDGTTYTAKVGTYPRDRSSFGVYDLAGNVAEWVDDYYGREPPQARARVSPRGLTGGPWRSARGGSWRMPAHMSMAPLRQAWPLDFAAPFIGFRCARDIP